MRDAARVVVVGGGPAGLTAAALLAAAGHTVSLIEGRTELGGASGRFVRDGYGWDVGPTSMVLPEVAEEILERIGCPTGLDLGWNAVVREHHFADGTALSLPGGSVEAQVEAVAGLGTRCARSWRTLLENYAEAWQVLREPLFRQEWDESAPRAARTLVGSRLSLQARLRTMVPDRRLEQVAGYAWAAAGHSLRSVPAWAGLTCWLEADGGTWTVSGGLWRIVSALEQRCHDLGVDLITDTSADGLVTRNGRAVGVRAGGDVVTADRVVVAADPRTLPELAARVAGTRPVVPAASTYLAMRDIDALPDLADEVVLHGDDSRPLQVLRTTGQAPAGCGAWTLQTIGPMPGSSLKVLAERTGLALEGHVEDCYDLSPLDVVQRWRGSPYGPAWRSVRSARDRSIVRAPVPGVFLCGAHATAGVGLPFALLSAHVAAEAVASS